MLTPEQKVEFQALRAVSERECGGFFDALNTYDNAVVSIGPCQWTLTLGQVAPDKPGEASVGELPATLAYAIGRTPSIERDHLQPFGIAPRGRWPAGQAGTAFKGSWRDTRNYSGEMQWSIVGGTQPMMFLDDLEYLRGTAWFWRLLVLTRRQAAFPISQWNMVRMRARDILTAKFGGTSSIKNAKLGEIFSSQLACALLVRLHVRYSGVTAPGNTMREKVIALAGATPQWGAPAGWNDAREARLLDALLGFAIRRTYPLTDIIAPRTQGEATLAELLDYGTRQVSAKKAKGLHLDFVAIMAWPDAGFFNQCGYVLDVSARTPLSRARNSFVRARDALIADATLPPPPVALTARPSKRGASKRSTSKRKSGEKGKRG